MLSAPALLTIILATIGSAFADLTVTIIGSNDIHGKAFPTTLSRPDTGQKYYYGGLVYMAHLIDILSAENKGNTLFLDAGDQFQGGIQSSKLISWGEIMNDFYNTIGVKASSIGNHQFDFGPQFLFPYMSTKKSSVNLAANIRSESDQSDFLPRQKSSTLLQLENGIKIGVIGLTTLETPASTSGFSSNKFPLYQFLQYKQVVLQESYKLKSAGANAIIIVSHLGNACPVDLVYKNRTKDTVQQPCPEDELTKLIDELPEGTVHGVVQGHRHRMAHHYRRNIPYIGTINGGYYINAMYLKFDHSLRLMDTLIEGPIPVCEKVFQNIGRCNYLSKDQLSTAGKLVHWKFHNKEVVAQQRLLDIYNSKWMPKMQPYFEELVNNEIELVKEDTRESQLANLFTNLLHEAIPEADFVILNPGGFRSEWVPGVIQYQHFYNMLPFDNIVQTFQISGSQLLHTLNVLQSGSKGFYHSWNLQMHVSYQNSTRRFLSAQFINGTQISENKNYLGVTIDFLLGGGDDFKDVINTVYTPRRVIDRGEYKALIKPFLVGMKTIRANTLIDPLHPRLIVN